MKRLSLFLVVGCLLMSRWAGADPFLMQGSRAIAMGGAFVAIAEDAAGASWNPAGYAKQKKGWDAELPVSMTMIGTGDIIKELNDVASMEYKEITSESDSRNFGGNSLATSTVSSFFKLLDGIDDLNKEGLGILMSFDAGLNVRIKNCGFSVVNHASFSGDPNIDLQNINLGASSSDTGCSVDEAKDAIYALVGTGSSQYGDDPQKDSLADNLVVLANDITGTSSILNCNQARAIIDRAYDAGLSPEEIKKYTTLVTTIAANLGTWTTESSESPTLGLGTTSQNSFEKNNSTLSMKGCAITEVMMTYARPYRTDKLSLGLNLKYMQGIMGYSTSKIFDEGAEDQVKDTMDKNTKKSASIGLDLGALYELNKKITLGLVIKNINSPSFAYPETAHLPAYKMQPQVRAGICLRPRHWLLFAIDSDLTKNTTILDGFNSKILSAGTELNIINRPTLNLSLRCGAMKNMAEDSVGVIYTGGLGITLLHLHANFTGLISDKKSKAENEEIPTAIGGSLQLSLNF